MHPGLAGVVLARGLVMLASLLVQLTPLAFIAPGLATLKPALLALMWLWSSGRARSLLAVALLATVAGAFLDALTPSYDAAAIWGWERNVLAILAEATTLAAMLQLVRGARLGLVVLTLGTLIWFMRLAGPADVEPVARPLSALLWSLGQILLFPSLRWRSRPPAQPLPAGTGAALFRWGAVELFRFLLLGGALVAAAAFSPSDRQLAYGALGVVLALGAVAALGYRWLARFCDGAAAAGGKTLLGRAVAILGTLVAASLLPDIVEALFADREAAMARAGGGAAAVCLLIALGVAVVAGAARRMLGKRRLATALAVSGRAMLVIPLLLIATPFVESLSWQLRRLTRDLMPLLAIAFSVAWLASVVLLMVAGLRANGAPGGVGEKVADGA